MKKTFLTEAKFIQKLWIKIRSGEFHLYVINIFSTYTRKTIIYLPFKKCLFIKKSFKICNFKLILWKYFLPCSKTQKNKCLFSMLQLLYQCELKLPKNFYKLAFLPKHTAIFINMSWGLFVLSFFRNIIFKFFFLILNDS